MKKRPSALFFFLLFLYASPSFSQRITLKPLFGYYLPKLNAVNDDIAKELPFWREFLETDLPDPGKIGGHAVYGGQLQFHFRESYFINVHVSFYRDAAETQFSDALNPSAGQFHYSRKVEFYDAILSLQYFFDYDSDNLFNTYLRIGAGVLSTNAKTETKSTFTASMVSNTFLPQVDTQGDFSGSTLTGIISAGMELRFTPSLTIWGEAGLQSANVGQLNGSLQRANSTAVPDYTTNTTFDFSGLFVRLGGGVGLPF